MLIIKNFNNAEKYKMKEKIPQIPHQKYSSLTLGGHQLQNISMLIDM